jgi:hypothetical protein
MTHRTSPHAGSPTAKFAEPLGVEDLDLSPQGLADAPASQQDPDSIVYAGNS